MATGLKEGGVPKKQMHPRLLNHHSGCFRWKENLSDFRKHNELCMCQSTAGKEERPRRSRWIRAYVCIPLDCLRDFFVIKISTLWDVALVVSGPDWLYVLGRARGYRLWASLYLLTSTTDPMPAQERSR